MKNRIKILSTTVAIAAFCLCSCSGNLAGTVSQTSSEMLQISDITSQTKYVAVRGVFKNISAKDMLQISNGNLIIIEDGRPDRLLKYDINTEEISVISELNDGENSIKLIAEDTVACINRSDSSKNTAVNVTDFTVTPLDEYYSTVKYSEYYANTNCFIKESDKFTVEKFDDYTVFAYPSKHDNYGNLTNETCTAVYTGKYLIAQYNTGVIMPATPEEESAEYYLIAYDYEENTETLLMQSKSIFTFSVIDENRIIVTEDSDKQTVILSCDGKTEKPLENVIRFSNYMKDGYFIKDGILYYVSNPINASNPSGAVVKYDINSATEEVIYTSYNEIKSIKMLDNGQIIAIIGNSLISTDKDEVIAKNVDAFFVANNKIIYKTEDKIFTVEI